MIGRKPTDTITVKDVPAHDFIVAYAQHLKKNNTISVPDNLEYWKTGVAKELAPYNPDWWYIRAASLARRIYLRPGIGVTRLSHIYGGIQNNGSAREHHRRGARKNLRAILIALEEANIVTRVAPEDGEDAKLLPRQISSQGQKSLNEIAKQVFNSILAAAQ
eukprot:TRINITY_DN1730_c1_g1_i1.p2 TRINITY_DN1730_c1_g1~~TRINITY_DN1730_c1_g1_i1.p2  ORF type:complete len:162 (+),score=31.57 TRINITY_DN1730_c1_g1_i1:15-500(+)